MDKFRILRSVESSTFQRLEPEELRVYLLLLANSGKNGRGTINGRSLRKAAGTHLSRKKIAEMCETLREHGLLQGVLLLPHDPTEHDLVLRYGIADPCG
ncbi:hypothetical protein [Geotalea toluenoxydans]|uniref:hypothetical protein n=1 Tax=Geotalea toluenoxydans TaxID=421624 RepID=UPI0006D08AB2|nr:hypothetical protein [Geotalea toluenoxydans]